MNFRFLCLAVLILGGCASDPVGINLYGLHYHDDAKVELSAMSEAVWPESMPSDGLRALILPFAVRQDVAVRKEVGREMADIFRLAWLESQNFAVLEYDAKKPWPGLEDALALAKDKGANILMVGNVSQFFEGSGSGRTTVGVTVEIYWVPSATLLWSAAQAGMMEGQRDKDYVLVRSSRRLPDQPTYAVMRALAQSMAQKFARHL